MTDAALGTVPTIAADELESPARRALRRLCKRKGAVVGLVVIALFIAARAVRAADRALRSDRDQLVARCASRPRRCTGSAPTSSAATCSRASSTARAPRCWPASISVGDRARRSACRSACSPGYLGGWIDALISRITDAMLACPFLILAIALAAFLGPSLGNAMIAIGITATPIFVRLTRGQVMASRSRITSRPRARSAIRAGASRCSTSCPTSCRRCWCRRRWRSPPRSSPRPACRSSASASSRRRRPGAACSTRRSASSSNAPWMAIWPGLAIFLARAVVQPARRRPARRARSARALGRRTDKTQSGCELWL